MSSLPPHLLNLQQKLKQLNIPCQIEKKPENKNNEGNKVKKVKIQNQIDIHKKEKKLELEKNWKIYRRGAGIIWEDKTLSDWPENDYRIFCGNLGNEVNDQTLSNAFIKYPSFVKAKIIINKKTLKSKGYGFVSLTDVNDYIKAMKEMNGKYVGNRPLLLKRSTWKERSLKFSKSKVKPIKFIRKRKRNNNNINDKLINQDIENEKIENNGEDNKNI